MAESGSSTRGASRFPRHRRDTTSLLLGLLLLGSALLFLVADGTDLSVDPRWVGPVVLVVIGLAGLVPVLRPATRPAVDAAPSDGTATD